jgi:hypothetical protein
MFLSQAGKGDIVIVDTEAAVMSSQFLICAQRN